MKKDKQIPSELEQLSPLLAQLHRQKQNPEVPKAYFEQLPDKILQKISVPQPTKAAPQVTIWDKLANSLQRAWQPQVALAFASLLLLAGAFFLLHDATSTSTQGIASLETEEIEGYIADNIDLFENEWIYDMATEEDLSVDWIDELPEENFDQLMDDILDETPLTELEELL